MRKTITLLLAALLFIMPCASANGLPYEKYDTLIRYLESGHYEQAFIEVARIAQNGQTGNRSENELYFEYPLAPEVISSDWRFHIDLINPISETIVLEELHIIDSMHGQPIGDPFVFSSNDLDRLGLGGMSLRANEGIGWDDGHPVADFFDCREYRFAYRTESGETLIMNFMFDVTGSMGAPSAPADATDWHFEILLRNSGDSPIRLVRLDIIDHLGEQMRGDPFVCENDRLNDLGLGDCVLHPGDLIPWGDNHPYSEDFDHREYRFTFLDSNDQEVVLSYPFRLFMGGQELLGDAAGMSYAEDPGFDLLTLRHDADFEEQFAPGIWWVPARTLGASAYPNEQIYRMLTASPEEKQAQIHTLYEALQMYQIGGFASADDNVRMRENDVYWEHHKPGYDAVRTNEGCCATSANWLNYILREDYEEVGFIATSQRDGSGHIYNYLLHNGWYYFIDLTHYRTDWVATAVENGDANAYYNSDFVLGNIHKAASVQDFVNYVQDSFGDPPGLMFQYTADNCLAVDSIHQQNGIAITYENDPDVQIHVIFDDPNDQLTFEKSEPPQQLPNWNELPDFDFSTIQ